MRNGINPEEARIVGFMDIGTNSVRLLVARVHPAGTHNVLSELKEMVRLGEGEFGENHLRPEVMDRCILVCQKFAGVAREFGAEEIIALATSASREATNREVFLQRLQEECGIDVRVISGREEARLIYLGVSSGLNLHGQLALFVDIGGGSTELVVGGQRGYLYLDSLKLGAMRLTSQFSKQVGEGTVSKDTYEKIRAFVRHNAARSIQRLKQHQIDLAVGSSGTILNLASVASRMFPSKKEKMDEPLKLAHLQEAAKYLQSLPLEERRKVPGLHPRRADIIIAGAAVLETLLEEMKLSEVRVSERSMKNGMLLDYMSRDRSPLTSNGTSLRVRSVLQLGHSFHFDLLHARRVTRLALQLFKSTKDAGLHNLGRWERELLEYSALLHDIGTFLSFTNHASHGYYIIRNSELLGFDQKEQAIIAAVVHFHRKGLPKAKTPECAGLDKKSLKITTTLSALLQIAESLNRGHSSAVRQARLAFNKKGALQLEILADQECELEVWGVNDHQKTFSRVFGSTFDVQVELEEAVLKMETAGEE